MFRLAHFSDPHLGPLPDIALHELLSKRITGFINWQRHRKKHLFGSALDLLTAELQALEPDHIALTGDLVNLAARREIPAARAWLDSFTTPDRLSVVPGNHDAYVRGALARVISEWHPYLVGDDAMAAIGNEETLFPYFRRRGNIALIGVSTATATPPFMASGYFGRRQARRLVAMLEQAGRDGLFRVIMIHHPPVRGAAENYKRMIGIRRFQAVLNMAGAELVLHGHTHLNTLYRLPSKTGAVPVVGISSASQGHGGKRPASGYNLFSIDGSAGNWTIRRERFALNTAGDGFERAVDDIL